MPDIKTRDVVKGTVKVIDKSAVAAERMKDAYVRTKDKAEHSVFAAESSPEEYAAARSSTLNAHYTSPTVIKAIYEAVCSMGFETGNILEPSMGVGNFFGLLPESMQNSRLYGVELDSITGRIAKQLLP